MRLRGGLGMQAALRLRSAKRRFPPTGLGGGRPGASAWNVLTPGEKETVRPTMGTSLIRRGDVILHTTASGGGWGDPLERDPEMVLADVLSEKVSPEHAQEAYGVVIDPKSLRIDGDATEELRRAMRARDSTAEEKMVSDKEADAI